MPMIKGSGEWFQNTVDVNMYYIGVSFNVSDGPFKTVNSYVGLAIEMFGLLN